MTATSLFACGGVPKMPKFHPASVTVPVLTFKRPSGLPSGMLLADSPLVTQPNGRLAAVLLAVVDNTRV